MTTEAQDKIVSASQTTVRELTLLLLYLTRMGESLGKWLPLVWRSWKGYDFNALDALEESGFLTNSHRAKSVFLTDKGIAEAKRLGEKYGVVSDLEENKLFPKFLRAVNALRDCCGDKKEIPPIAKSEVYNETWMLRLTLALINDSELDFSKIGNKRKEYALDLMRKALQRRWISEGGLEPAFEKEGTTWTDAILGDVRINNVSKRGIEVYPFSGGSTGIVVVEAKMGSELAPGISNSDNYNQAARNIACLAKLVTKTGNEDPSKCSFLVFAPRQKIEEWKSRGAGVDDRISRAWEIIESQSRERKWDVPDEAFKKAVEAIKKNSAAVAWEDVISSIQCQNGADSLRDFYKKTCDLFSITPQYQDNLTTRS